MNQDPFTPPQQPEQQSQEQPQPIAPPPLATAPIAPPLTNTQSPATASDPGKVFGIIGIVLSFLFMSLIGLILSIVGLVKSRKTGHKGTVSVVGIILNTLALLLTPFLLVAMLAFLQGVQGAANKHNSAAYGTQVQVDPNSDLGKGISDLDQLEADQANARQVYTRAEAYNTEAGDYPQSIDDFARYSDSSIPAAAERDIASSMPTKDSGTEAFYQYCSKGAAQVFYYDHTANAVASLGLGTMKDDAPSCR